MISSYYHKVLKMQNLIKEHPVFFTVLLFFLVTFIGYGQEITSDVSENKHSNNGPGFELVVSGVVIFNPEAGHTDPLTELHFTYWTSHTWAFGVGYSLIYEEEGRVSHEVATLVSHKPWPILTLNAGPSFALANSESDFKVSAYLEGELNIRIGNNGLHTGPVLGTLIGDEFRYFGGIHLGLEF
ncbi:hypothetical protein [uncultured Croceitalea sp.]|uniref:hypothetical protein n=1 Tax=uncultured Croceitalea sp. TaxID=1798908 RepID=UPI00374E47E6